MNINDDESKFILEAGNKFDQSLSLFDIHYKVSKDKDLERIVFITPVKEKIKLSISDGGILCINNRETSDSLNRSFIKVSGYYHKQYDRYIFCAKYIKTYTTENQGKLHKLYLGLKDTSIENFCNMYNLNTSDFDLSKPNSWCPLTPRVYGNREFSLTYDCLNYYILN